MVFSHQPRPHASVKASPKMTSAVHGHSPGTSSPPLMSLQALLNPRLPPLLTTWAALVPLVIHLTAPVDLYLLVGQIALQRCFSISLLPKLGTLRNLSYMLGNGQEFFDQASSRAGISAIVFDVRWGSVFPAANGAACRSIIDFALSKAHRQQILEEKGDIVPHSPASDLSLKGHVRPSFQRHQRLHVLNVKRRKPPRRSWGIRLFRLLNSGTMHVGVTIAISLVKFSIAIVAGLTGCYATSVLLLCTCIVDAICRSFSCNRPSGFLENNENHDAFMLVGSHVNASEWFLMTGDRGVVDCLLNKPLIQFEPQPWLSALMMFAHWLQIAAMTFVAAVQSADGFAMVLLIIWQNLVEAITSYTDPVAAQWLDVHGVRIEVETLMFHGRTQMLGAIYMNGDLAVNTWMDPILVPCPRRNTWLRQLRHRVDRNSDLFESETTCLSQSDRDWLVAVTSRTYKANSMLQSTLMRMTFDTLK